MPQINATNDLCWHLEVPFKGNRDYLAGTDIFNAIVAVTNPTSGVSLRFNRLMHYAFKLILRSDVKSIEKNAAGYMVQHESNKTEGYFEIQEIPEEPILCRVPYDEASVVSDAISGEDHIVSPGPSRFTFIERAVALNKVMLNTRIDLSPSERWLFTHLDLRIIPIQPRRVELRLLNCVGTKMCKSAISADSELVGELVFCKEMR